MPPRHIAFLVTRAALVVTGFVALSLFPVHPVESWQGLAFPGSNWIDGWVRWDSFWYESIVDAHPRFVPGHLSNANFFPFYSWVAWVVAWPLRAFLDLEHAFFIGALIVSSVSFVLALTAVDRIATNIAGREVAARTVWLIAVFPFSFFLTAVYADALYFCLCAWSLALALERRWYLACALAAMAAMTRIPGVALFPALGLEYLRQREWKLKISREAIICAAILALGPIVIGSYYEWRYDNPLEFVRARQELWNRASGSAGYVRDYNYFFQPPIFGCSGVAECVKDFAPTRALLGVTYLALLPLTIVITIVTARTLGVALVAWTLLSIVMALPNGFDGIGRFTAVLFPVFIALAMRLGDRRVFGIVCIACVPFLLLFFAQFARWRQVL
ncbi:MAG: hypothetical protein K2Y23_05400 [Cyanobacteria bacterium]|nr:hypothetical protein [Cyanobacteriota bacterium]